MTAVPWTAAAVPVRAGRSIPLRGGAGSACMGPGPLQAARLSGVGRLAPWGPTASRKLPGPGVGFPPSSAHLVPGGRLRILVHPSPDEGPTAPQLFSICSISNSPSREQGLLRAAPRPRQAEAGSPHLPQPSSSVQPSDSSQHSSSLQAGWSSKDGGRGSGTGVPAGVLPPGPEAEAESKAVQDLVLPTCRGKGLWGLRPSVPELGQLRLLKVSQFCGDRHTGY